MLVPTWNLPPGVHVETDRDERTVDVLNSTDAPVTLHLADVMRSFGVVVGEDEGVTTLEPGQRFTFYRGTSDRHFSIDITCRS